MTRTQQIAKRVRVRRYKQRKAGLLPPVPTCRRCGGQCQVEAYLPFCGCCALQLGAPGTQRGVAKDPRRAAALQLLWELRIESMEPVAPEGVRLAADCLKGVVR